MNSAMWLGVYAQIGALLLPVVCFASVGAVWAVQKKAFPADFVAQLATVFSTPALVFYTLMTTWLDNAQLLQVGLATLLGLGVAALLSALALRAMNLPARTLGPAVTFPNTGNLGLPIAQLVFGALQGIEWVNLVHVREQAACKSVSLAAGIPHHASRMRVAG